MFRTCTSIPHTSEQAPGGEPQAITYGLSSIVKQSCMVYRPLSSNHAWSIVHCQAIMHGLSSIVKQSCMVYHPLSSNHAWSIIHCQAIMHGLSSMVSRRPTSRVVNLPFGRSIELYSSPILDVLVSSGP
jgi:hypothetical protein